MAKIEMTEEIANALKGILPISNSTRKKFTPSLFKTESFPKDFAPVFVIRGMTKAEKTAFLSDADKEEQSVSDLVFSCIDKAENLWDIDTRKIVPLSREIYDELHYHARRELFDEVLVLSGLSTVDKLGLK
jgi:hypothetical protein